MFLYITLEIVVSYICDVNAYSNNGFQRNLNLKVKIRKKRSKCSNNFYAIVKDRNLTFDETVTFKPKIGIQKNFFKGEILNAEDK